MAIGTAHRDDLYVMVRDPVTVLSLLVEDVQAMGGWEAVLPGCNKAAGFGIGNEIVVSVVRQEDNSPRTILGDPVAILYGIVGTVEQAPVP